MPPSPHPRKPQAQKRLEKATTLFELGERLRKEDNLKEASEIFMKAGRAMRGVGASFRKAKNVEESKKAYQNAGKAYWKASQAYRSQGLVERAAIACRFSAHSFTSADDYQKAINMMKSSASYFNKAGRFIEAANSFMKAGHWLLNRAEGEKAGDSFRYAAKLFWKGGLFEKCCEAYLVGGDAYLKAGKAQKAERIFSDADRSCRFAGDYVKAKDAYIKKMTLVKERYKSTHKLVPYLGYLMWQEFSNFGESVGRWFLTCVILIFSFSLLYLISGSISYFSGANRANFAECLYYSIITFTNLGSNTLVPKHVGLVLTTIESFLGLVMLGIFVTIIAKKVAT